MEFNQNLIRRISGGEVTIPVTTTDTITLGGLRRLYGRHIKGIKTITALTESVIATLEENDEDVLTSDKYLGFTTTDNTIPANGILVPQKYITSFALTSGSVNLVIE